jgi:hypothetical protein
MPKGSGWRARVLGGFKIADFRLKIGDLALKISDCGLIAAERMGLQFRNRFMERSLPVRER